MTCITGNPFLKLKKEDELQVKLVDMRAKRSNMSFLITSGLKLAISSADNLNNNFKDGMAGSFKMPLCRQLNKEERKKDL